MISTVLCRDTAAATDLNNDDAPRLYDVPALLDSALVRFYLVKRFCWLRSLLVVGRRTAFGIVLWGATGMLEPTCDRDVIISGIS